jgi:betaine reductase complex component B subunit alpha
MSVLAVGKHWGGFQDGLIDMSGEGAKYTYYSQLKNVVLVADTDETFEHHEQQKKNHALRWAGMRLAEYIGACTKGLKSDEVETYALDPITKRDEAVAKLPSVVFVLQPQSQMEDDGYNDLNYGWNCNWMLPTLMHPNEVLDGAMISGSFMPCSSKWSTYDFQNFPMIKRLYEEHGQSINFLGIINVESKRCFRAKGTRSTFCCTTGEKLGRRQCNRYRGRLWQS